MTALIGALRVSMSADTAKFEDGMARARATSQKTAGYIKSSLGGIGFGIRESLAGLVAGLSVGLFANLIKQSLEYAGSLAETAQQIGVTAKDLQTLRFAAGQVGVSQEQLETGLSKLTITLGKVAAGAVAPTKALKAIGLSVDDVKGKDTGTVFRLIADGLGKVTDRAQRAAVEVALFGKTGASLDNLLSGGRSALDNLTSAAEKLGIVLSDEQIRKADDTADKLEALKTVLQANIAGVVADNANAILQLANALMTIVAVSARAAAAFGGFLHLMAATNGIGEVARGVAEMASGNFSVGVQTVASGIASLGKGKPPAAPSRRPVAMPATPKGGDIGQFLAPAGAKPKKAAADHSAQDRLRADNQFDQELRRAQMDVLHAQQDLATDYVERTTIGIQILDSEKSARDAQHRYEVALYALTKGKEGESPIQAQQLQAQEDIKDGLERQKLLTDEQDKRQEEVAKIAAGDLDRRRSALEAQDAIATTASERRKIELELLRIAYEQRKQALQNTIDTSKDDGEKENARRDLASLNATYSADRRGVLNQTRGPLEEWAASMPQTAAQINEAIQSIEVNGLDGLSGAIADVISGTKNLGDAFGEVAKSIIADLIQMAVKMLVFRALSAAIPGLFGSSSPSVGSSFSGSSGFDWSGGSTAKYGFAMGGGFTVLGKSGVDKNLLSINGLPIANVSHGEHISVSNDNASGVTINQTFAPNFAGNAATHEDLMQMAVMTRSATLEAVKQANRRR
jgi:hypothetical protein